MTIGAIMRSRSTRFFVILLHLVGCRPRQFYFQLHQGIVGVQPWPIVLEKLDLSRVFQNEEDEHHHPFIDMNAEEAVWLQNDQGRCLGPTGRFTDCGDATLWFIVKRKLPRRRKLLQMGLLGAEEDTNSVLPPPAHVKEGLAFYMVDRDVETRASPTNTDTDTPSPLSSDPNDKSKGWWRRIFKKRKEQSPKMECLTYDEQGNVAVQSCTKKTSWAWEMDSEGAMKPLVSSATATSEQCLVNGESGVSLGPCGEASHTVNISVVRYRAVSLPDALQHLKGKEGHHSYGVFAAGGNEHPAFITTATANAAKVMPTDEVKKESRATLPLRRKDLAHLHASEPPHHRSLKINSKPSLAQSRKPKRRDSSCGRLSPPMRILHGANPVNAADRMFARNNNCKASSTNQPSASSSRATTVPSAPQRTRKIPVHPYIAASKNEIWTDPQTSLEYPTDLSGYLNIDRKEKGRHTLMGVGQYRKGYVIKVYGVAFYVSKRDVLADPFFADYADMTADELKARPEFYEHLRLHAQNFDRTIIIKINMQLAADTIRSSLHADWKMLTEEAKDTLISSSLKPRPASPEFLALVADQTKNPGRCSCGQVCPEEYGADLDCCARGTELAFTWLKSGDIEVRLNGELIESFPRPDIAEGILFEYLRYDDPISPEFRDNVVQGFPFLLAPLAQVKGVQVPQSKPTTAQTSLPPHKAVWQMIENAQAGVVEWASGAQQAALEAASQQVAAAGRFMEQGTQNMLHEANKRRQAFVQQVQGLPGSLRSILTNSRPGAVVLVNDTLLLDPLEEDPSTDRLARLLLDQVYPDEIGPPVRQVHPQRQIYLLLVHLYLLLLLIVSFPGSYTTKLIRRKKSNANGKSSGLPLQPKSLSYYL